jgi:2-methylisocitrate lyase-like PEP mutase family enzyme
MSASVQFPTLSAARAGFKDLLDAAEEGRPATVRRDHKIAAVVDADRLRCMLAALRPAEAQIVAEAGGWSIFIPGLPLAADAGTFEEAVDYMVLVLREYGEDWQDRLLHAPNHAGNWGLVQLIALSDDEQLKAWLVGQ